MVGADLLGFPHNFVSCKEAEGLLTEDEGLPRIRCDYGYRVSEHRANPRDPVDISAVDATAVAVMSGMVESGQLGFPLNYIKCTAPEQTSCLTRA